MTKKELCDIICKLMGVTECSATVLKQINTYVNKHGWSYKDIARAFVYFVKIEHGKPEPKFGIGIVAHNNGRLVETARKYYDAIAKQREKQAEAAKIAVKKEKEQRKVIVAKPYDKPGVRRKQIDISKL